MFVLRINHATDIPDTRRIGPTSPTDLQAPRCSVEVKLAGRTFKSKVANPGFSPTFDEVFSLGAVQPKDRVEFYLYCTSGQGQWIVGETEIEAGDLARRPSMSLVMFDSSHRAVTSHRDEPCMLHVAIVADSLPEGWPAPAGSSYPTDTTHVMIITRGTRGDVQPFIALARGLAERLNWVVTICTELNCKAFVKSFSNVSQGAIRFLPSGGNTPARINTAISRWAINSKSEFMQAMMLARSEIEFFDSAALLIHWARIRQPQLLIYGFTLPNIAMMISELLLIPAIGFILQPSVIPSGDTVAVESLNTHFLCCVDRVERQTAALKTDTPLKRRALRGIQEQVTGHVVQSWLKWAQENAPALGQVNRVRRHYSLFPLRMNSYEALQKQDMPLIIPINPFCFGNRPKDWAPNTVFTDFIFLREDKEMHLDATFTEFINVAKAAQSPIVLMAFSSMPVPRSAIMEMAIKIIEECAQMPRVIALVGAQAGAELKEDLKAKVQRLQEANMLLEAAGAPFGALFPHMSVLIVHGGLGTTAEAIRSGHPVIVTGVLLMDQRFWGKRVAELQLGPEPVHIDDFKAVCVTQVEQCLTQSCIERCKVVAAAAAGKSPDGVEENVMMVKRMFEEGATPWTTTPAEFRCCGWLRNDSACSIA